MRILVTLLLIGIFTTSCVKEEPEPVIINTIESEFQIIPWQILNPGSSDFSLIIRSDEVQDCLNSELDANIDWIGNTLNIQINGIVQNEPCNQGQAYAESNLTLDMAPGLYDFVINLGSSIQNTGTIEIDTDVFKLDLTDNTGIALIQDSLLRIEEGVSWGYLDDRLVGTLVNPEINASISEEINIVTTFREGNYGHFEVGDLNSIIIAGSPDNVTSMLLDTRKSGAWQQLKEILLEAETKYPDLKYRFTRWDGLEIWN